MILSKEQVEHIAGLSRLELTEEEKEKYGSQLSAVLGYIDQLQEVATDDVQPTAQVTGLVNVFREDEAKDWPQDEIDAAIKDAPDSDGKNIRVKRVLE